MKSFKRILTVILSMVLVFSFSGFSFASSTEEETEVTITKSELQRIQTVMLKNFADNYIWQVDSIVNRAFSDGTRLSRLMSLPGTTDETRNVSLGEFQTPDSPYSEVGFVTAPDGNYLANPYSMLNTETKVITFTIPITMDGELIGAVDFDMNSEKFENAALPLDTTSDYIKGVVMKDADGKTLEFLDYGKDFDGLREITVKSDVTGWQFTIYADFSEVTKQIFTLEDSKNILSNDAETQTAFQLKSSTDYIKNYVTNVANINTQIMKLEPETIANGPDKDMLLMIAEAAITPTWTYDDIYFAFESDGKYIGLDETVSPETDFRTRPWYIAAKTAGGVTITDFYDSITGSRQEIMTVAAPIFEPSGKMYGAFAMDITTDTAKKMLYNGDSSLRVLMEMINSSEGNYRVAYIARSRADTFGNWLAEAVEAESEKYQNISIDIFNGEADNDKQIAYIEEAIANKYDCIILQPQNGEVIRPYAEKIVAAGIKLITTNPKIDDIKGGSTVDADPYSQAKVNCDLAYTLIPKNAKVVVLKGPKGNFHADERREAWQKEFFDRRPDVTIVGEDYADWSKETAKTLMKGWTASGETVDAIISMNDDMCVGALEAIKDNASYKDTLAFGVDGTAEALLLIKEGTMTSTCMQNAYELSELILDTADKLLTGTDENININIGNPLVTAQNVDEYIAMLKKAGAM